jgi:hypothetical protein
MAKNRNALRATALATVATIGLGTTACGEAPRSIYPSEGNLSLSRLHLEGGKLVVQSCFQHGFNVGMITRDNDDLDKWSFVFTPYDAKEKPSKLSADDLPIDNRSSNYSIIEAESFAGDKNNRFNGLRLICSQTVTGDHIPARITDHATASYPNTNDQFGMLRRDGYHYPSTGFWPINQSTVISNGKDITCLAAPDTTHGAPQSYVFDVNQLLSFQGDDSGYKPEAPRIPAAACAAS